MILYSIMGEYQVFPCQITNSVAIPIDNGVVYLKNNEFNGLFSTNPYDYLKISEFKNGGLARGYWQQKKYFQKQNNCGEE